MILQLWDTAGQEKFQSLGTSFYRGADGCALVYDVTNSNSFETIPQWKDEFVSQAFREDCHELPIVVLGNKTDLTPKRKVSEEMAVSWCTAHRNLSHFSVSAKDRTNIEEAFAKLGSLAFAYYSENGKNMQSVHLATHRRSAQRKCCRAK